MRRFFIFAIVSLLTLTFAEARKPSCTLRAHVEGNANDSDVFSSQLHSPATGKNVTIEKVAAISEADVAAFRAYPANDGSYGVLFLLNEHGKLALDTLSIDRRGTFLYLFVNGRPAAELKIDRRVSDGKLYVGSGLTAADIELIKQDWPLIGARKKRT